jgi:hypothetical protein
MRIAVLLIVLAVWPWQAGAQPLARPQAAVAPVAVCQLGAERAWHALEWGNADCWWSVADEQSSWQPSPEWRYRAGATLFVVGNMLAFSFPVWAAMGADAVVITGVIITGELIEVAGIYLLGEEAFHQVKGKLGQMVDRLRSEFEDFRTSLPAWS